MRWIIDYPSSVVLVVSHFKFDLCFPLLHIKSPFSYQIAFFISNRQAKMHREDLSGDTLIRYGTLFMCMWSSLPYVRMHRTAYKIAFLMKCLPNEYYSTFNMMLYCPVLFPLILYDAILPALSKMLVSDILIILLLHV